MPRSRNGLRKTTTESTPPAPAGTPSPNASLPEQSLKDRPLQDSAPQPREKNPGNPRKQARKTPSRNNNPLLCRVNRGVNYSFSPQTRWVNHHKF